MSVTRMVMSAVVAVGLACGPAAAQARAAVPSSGEPRILGIDRVRWHPADNTVTARVTYRCTDRPAPAGTMHFGRGGIVLGDEWDRKYSMGDRNGPGGTVRVFCTGKRVRQTFTFLDGTGFRYPPEPPSTEPVRPGYYTMSFGINQTATWDQGGWYSPTGLGVSTEGSVWVRPAAR